MAPVVDPNIPMSDQTKSPTTVPYLSRFLLERLAITTHEAIDSIEQFVKSSGTCSKDQILLHMNWHPKSRQISWTKYRKYLRRSVTEDAQSAVVVFTDKQTRSVALKRAKRSRNQT